MTTRGRVDHDQVVRQPTGVASKIFDMPDLSEGDQFPPTRSRRQQLLEGGLVQALFDQALHADLQAEVFRECGERVDVENPE